MKRKQTLSSEEGPAGAAKRPRARPEVPDYHLTPSIRDAATGATIWPAPDAQIRRARDIILEWFVSRRI